MKISLVITTLNEAKHISILLESIASQTLLPDELVVFDSFSGDNTVDIIKDYSKTAPFKIQIHQQQTNRSQGRNLAISKATNQIIAVTDAGCILDRHWLERITEPIRKDLADSVAGYYLPITPTCFEKSIAPYVSVMPDQFDHTTFLPSSRSVAFTKLAWEKVGGYPENLNYCEDLIFARSLKSMTRMSVARHAVVYWMQSTNLFSFFRQISNYAQGDVEARYKPHLFKIATIYARYLLFLIFPPLFIIYLGWAVAKHYHHVCHRGCIIFLPIIQLTSDLAVLYGSSTAYYQQAKLDKR